MSAEGSNSLPSPIHVTFSESMRDYWLKRVEQHFHDRYAGVPISKFPEDLRVYEHLIWLSRPSVVIEIGAQHGGSALWFRDRLRTLAGYGLIAHPLVVSIDLDVAAASTQIAAIDPRYEETIKLVEGDCCDPSLAERVERLLPGPSCCLVVEDSAHTYETTTCALSGFSRFVPPGGFFVVEDGCVDVEEMRAWPEWPRGVLPALHDWLGSEQGSAFEIRRDLELYGISCHPEGFLQRVA
jgi:cephalosporin hydroxylase